MLYMKQLFFLSLSLPTMSGTDAVIKAGLCADNKAFELERTACGSFTWSEEVFVAHTSTHSAPGTDMEQRRLLAFGDDVNLKRLNATEGGGSGRRGQHPHKRWLDL